MIFVPGQELTLTGPDGITHPGRVLAAYRSTGGLLSVWIDLCEDYAANPANELGLEWITPVLVVTERDGEYRDLWGGTWALNPTPGAMKGCQRRC